MFSSVFSRSGVLSISSKTRYLHRAMANFKFSYVRSFEANDRLAPDQWIVISLENKNPEFKRQAMRNRQSRLKFTEFMNKNAIVVMDHFKEIRFSYVHSANAHFVFDGSTTVYQRRSSKLVSYIASCLSSIGVMNWPKFLDFPMRASPCFEGKIFLFPNDQHLRDYFTLNQMNHHLENLRQTLIEAIKGDNPNIKASQSNVTNPGSGSDGGCSTGGTIPVLVSDLNGNESSPGHPREGDRCITSDEKNASGDSDSLVSGSESPAENLNVLTSVDSNGKLLGSAAAMKRSNCQTVDKKAMLASAAVGTESYCNEKLYADYRINYNNEPKILKKGTLSLRHKPISKTSRKEASGITSYHEDLRKNAFWESLSVVSSETNFNSKFFMLPKFQRDCSLTPHAWIVVRLDGKAFHKMAEVHKFKKPNDIRAIELMNISAATLMKAMPDLIMAYGESDEYSFVFHRYGTHYNRHPDALVSQCVSIFTAAYVKYWPSYFGKCSSSCTSENVTESASKKDVGNDSESMRNNTDSLEENVCAPDSTPEKETVISKSVSAELASAGDEVALKRVPVFDGRAVVYPTTNSLRDYLSWRQADCHVNNMYNTAFWALVLKGGYTRADAEKKLNGTFSKDKRQILLDMGINYDEEPAIYRKGSFIYRKHKVPAKARSLKKESKPVRNEVWWSDQCHQLKKTRTDLRKKYLQSNSNAILTELLRVEIEASRIFKKAKKKYKRESKAALHSGSSHSQSSPEDSTTSSSSAGAEDPKIETSFDDEEVVVPENFLADFEKRLNIDNIDPEEKKRILNSFNRKRKPWWTMECHLAKVVRREALLAFKSAPSEESERAYHLSCIRFRAFVHEAKARQKKTQVLKQSKNASSKDNKENLVRDEEGAKLDEHQEESVCVQREEVVDRSVNPLKEKEANFIGGVENRDEIISMRKADDVIKSHVPETVEMKSGNEFMRADAREIGAHQSTEADSKVAHSGSQDPLHPSDNVASAMQGRMAEHEARVASVSKDLVLCFSDIIGDQFWSRRPYILGDEKSALDFEENL